MLLRLGKRPGRFDVEPEAPSGVSSSMSWNEKDPIIVKSSITLAALSCVLLAACAPENQTAAKDRQVGVAAPHAARAPEAAPSPTELTAAGLGDLRIGAPVPAASGWTAPDAKSDGCATARSADYKGVYALIEQEKVQRITLGAGSDVKLAGGIGIGSSEAEVKKQFAELRDEPHKYDPAPAKYLTSTDASASQSGLRGSS